MRLRHIDTPVDDETCMAEWKPSEPPGQEKRFNQLTTEALDEEMNIFFH